IGWGASTPICAGAVAGGTHVKFAAFFEDVGDDLLVTYRCVKLLGAGQRCERKSANYQRAENEMEIVHCTLTFLLSSWIPSVSLCWSRLCVFWIRSASWHGLAVNAFAYGA